MTLSLIRSLDQADPARAEFDEAADAWACETFGTDYRERERETLLDEPEPEEPEPVVWNPLLWYPGEGVRRFA